MTTTTFTTAIRPPLKLVPSQTGLTGAPLNEGAAIGQDNLDVQQRAIVIGEPVPIVFTRRVDGIGGVLVSPGATEGRYENDDTTNELTVNLHLVLSEGQLGQLQLRDVFQRACRVGTWAQTYNRRAGTWTPGNFIVPVAGKQTWDCPYYCGTSGYYTNLTTLSYTNTHQDGDDTWDKQVHVFVRSGMEVERILDSVTGPSNNVVDLALYLIRSSSRFPELLIDIPAMSASARFTDVNGFFYNGVFKDSSNLEDWLERTSPYFLLRVSDKNGKKGFRPRIPTNGDGTIYTGVVSWVFTFTEEHLVPGGFNIEYISLADRKPIVAQVLWRQQPEADLPVIRTAEVRLTGTSAEGPYEQYDLSELCASENHAVKYGAYVIARRTYINHTLRIRVKPDAFNSTLVLGDLVRVFLQRQTNDLETSFHNYLYEVERIYKTPTGVVELDLIHFPIDSAGRSIVAVAVNATTATGYVYPTGRNDFSCDISGRSEDTTPLPDTGGNLPGLPAPGSGNSDVPDPGEPGEPAGGAPNPADPIGEPTPEICGIPTDRPLLPGDTLSVCSNICEGQYNEWWLCPIDGTEISQDCQLVSSGVAAPYIVAGDASGKRVFVRGRCPDPGSPDGYGPPNDSAPTEPVDFGWNQYTYARWTGTIRFYGQTQSDPQFDQTISKTTPWLAIPTQGLTLSGAWGCFSGSTPLPGGPYSVWILPPAASTWRSGMTIQQIFPCEGGVLSAARFGPATNPNACASGDLTLLRFGCVLGSFDFKYTIAGTFEFSNDGATVLAEWGGRATE